MLFMTMLKKSIFTTLMILNKSCNEARKSYRLPRASAGACGISAKGISNLFEDFENNNVRLHSFMLVKDGAVAYESYSAPFGENDTHSVYSISKSFLSVALSFAIDEGLLSENTLFTDIFPEYKKKKDKYLAKLSVYDLISMRSGKRLSVLMKKSDDWVADFVSAPWDFEPGTDFRYVNENYYVLSEMICKLSGCSLTEYLTPRLYEPLGIDTPFWETSPKGYEAGGWGLHLKTEDIAKFVLCCQSGGVFEGNRIINEEYIKKATSKISGTAGSQRKADSKAGYGYGFWQCENKYADFRCEGMYSQYAVSLKVFNACIVTTSTCADLQRTLDVLWRHIEELFNDSPEECNVKMPSLADERISKPQRSLEEEKRISGSVYTVKRKRFLKRIGREVSVFPTQTIYFAKEKGGNIDNVRFDFCDDRLYFSWNEHKSFDNKITCGLNGEWEISEMSLGEIRLKVYSVARWLSASSLEITVLPVGEAALRRLVFDFSGDKFCMYPDASPSLKENSKSVGETIKCVLPGAYFKMWVDILVPKVTAILQPVHKGVRKPSSCRGA